MNINTYTVNTRVICSVLLLIFVAGEGIGQSNMSTYAGGLSAPIGIEIDHRGWIWVAEQGTGNDDSRVSVVTSENQVTPFITGLPSGLNAQGEVTGTNHVYFNDKGELLIVQGEGTDSLSQAILVMDTTGFTPGSAPLGHDAIKAFYKLGDFVHDAGFAESNPYTLTVGPEGDLFIADAAANAVLRRDSATGDLSVFATYPNVSNNTGIGPPMIQAVPTGIVFRDSIFAIGTLTGFPFPDGAASIYKTDLSGTTSLLIDNLTTVVDVTLDGEGRLLFLQHGAHQPPPPFAPNTGLLLRSTSGVIDTLATGLNRPTGIRSLSETEIYVSTLIEGEVVQIQLTSTAVDAPSSLLPEGVVLEQNFPNPFNPSTTIRYHLSGNEYARLTIYDLEGKRITTLTDGHQTEGWHTIRWNGQNHAGEMVSAGMYLYRLVTESRVKTKKMVYLK